VLVLVLVRRLPSTYFYGARKHASIGLILPKIHMVVARLAVEADATIHANRGFIGRFTLDGLGGLYGVNILSLVDRVLQLSCIH
jgi:hypothetical protein